MGPPHSFIPANDVSFPNRVPSRVASRWKCSDVWQLKQRGVIERVIQMLFDTSSYTLLWAGQGLRISAEERISKAPETFFLRY